MAAILPFLRADENVFNPTDITAMSTALDEVCSALKVQDRMTREVVAVRIIELARHGERDPTKLRDRALYETGVILDALANPKGAA